MSEADTVKHLIERIDLLSKTFLFIKLTLGAVLGLGMWVAWQTFTLLAVTERVRLIEEDRGRVNGEWRSWRERMDSDMATVKVGVSHQNLLLSKLLDRVPR